MDKKAPQEHFYFDQSKSGQLRDYILYDVLADITGVHTKRLFGGYGFYLEDVIFGAYMDDDKGLEGFFLKATEVFAQELEDHGAKQFIYTGHKTRGPTAMPYWHIPEELLENREQITEWVYRAWELFRRK